jgi:hypothetical protein
MAKMMQVLFGLFITIVIIFVVYVLILVSEKPPQLDYVHRVSQTKVKRGSDLVIYNKLDRPITCASWWHRYLYDEAGVQVVGFSEYRPAGSGAEYSRSIRIPSEMMIGRATYQAAIFWECNWVQHLKPYEVNLPTIQLQITP